MLTYTLQHRNINLYSCIASESQFFKGVFYLKQIIIITGCPLGGGAGQLPPLPPLIRPWVRVHLQTSVSHPWTRKGTTLQNFKGIVTLKNFWSPAKKWKADH